MAALVERKRRAGAEPDGWTASARWSRETEIPDQFLFGAYEALAGAGV